MRIGVEHSSYEIDNLFPIVDFSTSLKLNEREVGKYIVVAA